MKVFNSIRFQLTKALLITLSLVVFPAGAETITVGGTGSGMGIMQLLGTAFSKSNPEHHITILPSLGSSGGIKAVKSSAIDIGIASRKLKPEEEAGLISYEVGRSPFVFVSHPGSAIKGITLKQVVDIYSGKMTVWPDGSLIRPVLRPMSDSDSTLLMSISPEMESAVKSAHAREGMSIAVTDTDSADMIEKVNGGFGTSTLVLVKSENRNIKILSFDGVLPTSQVLREEKYKLSKPFYLIVRENATESAKKFIAYIQSSKGRELLEKSGMNTSY